MARKEGGRAQPEPHAQETGVITPIVITLAVQSMVSLIAVSVPVFMPVASEALQFKASLVGIFVSLIYIGATISAPLSGYFVNRLGPIGVSQICLLLSGVGLACFYWATIPWMVIGTLIIGFGYGPVTPASSHLLVKTTPPHVMSMVFSIKQTGVPLGGVLAGGIVPHLVIFFGWRASALIVAGSSIALMLLMEPYRHRYDQYVSGNARFSLKSLLAPVHMALTQRDLRPVVLASFFFATMQLCFISFIVTYLIEDIGMTLVRAGIMLSAAQFAGILGRIFWGTLADRVLSPRLMLGLLGIAMACASFVTTLFTSGWPHSAVLLVCIFFGAVAIGWNGVYLAEVARVVKPELAGLATGGSLFFTFLGVLVGLPLFSMLVDTTDSYQIGFLCTAVVTLIYGLVLCFSRRPCRRHSS